MIAQNQMSPEEASTSACEWPRSGWQCSEKRAFRPDFEMKVTFLSGKMAKSHTNGKWLVALADRDTGRLCGLGGLCVWRELGSKGSRTRHTRAFTGI